MPATDSERPRVCDRAPSADSDSDSDATESRTSDVARESPASPDRRDDFDSLDDVAPARHDAVSSVAGVPSTCAGAEPPRGMWTDDAEAVCAPEATWSQSFDDIDGAQGWVWRNGVNAADLIEDLVWTDFCQKRSTVSPPASPPPPVCAPEPKSRLPSEVRL